MLNEVGQKYAGTARYSRWDAMYDLLVDYGRETGSCDVPLSCKVCEVVSDAALDCSHEGLDFHR